MRHIGSFLLAAVFGPAIFLLTGTGLSAFESARRHAFVDDPLAPLAALGALLLAGMLYGLLIMVRLSPVGPGLAGTVLFGLSTWALVAPKAYDSWFEALNVHMGGAVGQWGLGFLLGVPLLATLTSPRRWRRIPYGDAYYVAPSTLDATRQMPAQPTYRPAPDVEPPSLRYPPATPPYAPPSPSSPPRSSPPAPPTVVITPPEPPTVPLIVPPAVPAAPSFSHAAPPESPAAPASPPPVSAPSFSHAESPEDEKTDKLEP